MERKSSVCVKDYALIYAAGFLLSSSRIREIKSVSLHQSFESHEISPQFINWCGDKADQSYPVYFWGDFDLAVMGILKSLKMSFTNVKLWQPGYQTMSELVDNGDGHPLSHRQKQSQNDPEKTGCRYADDIILPQLREQGLCFDQEGVPFSLLDRFIELAVKSD